MKYGVANAVAKLQKLVVRGQVHTIALDSETFGTYTHALTHTSMLFLLPFISARS